jgi:hypothetical protein
MMTPIPENEIHHLKESLEENSFQKKIQWILLLVFLLLVTLGALTYTYYYRDLPKCQDEAVQILLNQNIRSNEVLIGYAQTLAFEGFKEISHDDSRRSCETNLITNHGKYRITYLLVNDLIEQNWFSRLVGAVKYSVAIEKIQAAQ